MLLLLFCSTLMRGGRFAGLRYVCLRLCQALSNFPCFPMLLFGAFWVIMGEDIRERHCMRVGEFCHRIFAIGYICTWKISFQTLPVGGWMIRTRQTLYNTTNWYIRIFCRESISDFLPYHDREWVLQTRQDCNANYPRSSHFPTRFRHVKTTQNTTNIITEFYKMREDRLHIHHFQKIATTQRQFFLHI